ncbi:MAG: hypothetical protein HON70_04175, partial [Lentisphaerae bacterium]|nr:hypothetical protein [Lentisphaerota bacterium]
ITHVRFCYDDQALYVAVSCRAGTPREALKKRAWDDGGVWRDDHLELFVNTRPDREEYQHLVLDRAGSQFDQWRTDREGVTSGPAWNGKWNAVTVETDDGWSAEFALPHAVFADASPQPGDLWRLRIGRDAGVDGPIMWPPNQSGSFHQRFADAALYFETMNLLKNGDFEEGEPRNGAPSPWTVSLTSSEVDNRLQGTVTTVAGGAADGQRALRLTKLGTALWWPQIWNWEYSLTVGGVYEFSILARGTMPQVNLRATARVEGRAVKMSEGRRPGKEFERLRYRFMVPEGATSVGVGISAPAGAAGETLFDDAVLRRLLHRDGATRTSAISASPPDFSPDPDPIHGLEALSERAGHKPWDRYWRGDRLISHRVMFRDRKHGTWLWLLDNSPSVQYCVTASIWPGWNADGSVLYVNGPRQTPDSTPKSWLFNADFSALRPHPFGGMPLWDREDPSVYYCHSGSEGKVWKVDLRTGRETLLASWKPRARERSYGLTKDNRSVFVTDHDGGLWVPYEPTEKPLPYVNVLDCYGQGRGGEGIVPSKLLAAEDEEGPVFRVLIGTRVYTDTGRTERVVVPISGHTEYLRTFASGRVRFPDDAEPPATKDLDELFQIYHLYPSCSHGHLSYSPDGEYVCWDGTTRSHRVRDHGDLQQHRVTLKGGVYHACWFSDPRFFVTCVRAYRSSYDRAHNSGLLTQAFSDGTWQPVCDIKMRPAAFYYQGNFATLSRDATKIHYESSMTGVPKNYIAVMARPQAPRDLSCRTDGDSVLLEWTNPPHSREVRGYLVYRSERSGDGYVLRTPQPVEGATFRDTLAASEGNRFFVVTALEHTGLESGYSNEVAAMGTGTGATSTDSLVVYAEAEDALVDLSTADRPGISRGRDMLRASNWYYIYRSPEAQRGEAALPVRVPRTGLYSVWLRTRRGSTGKGRWTGACDGQALGTSLCTTDTWDWHRLDGGQVRLMEGKHRFTLATDSVGAQADVLCLATDPAFVPEGGRPEDVEPPRPVSGVRVESVEGRTVALSWDACPAPDVWHYNVYGARAPITEPMQESLLASPTTCEFIDWGLRAGTAYHYAVTAVDRRGNESEIARCVAAGTAPRAGREIELRFDEAQARGPFSKREAEGTRAANYLVLPGDTPEGVARDSSLRWAVDVPAGATEGRWYLWLRYLPGGSASTRRVAVEQNVRVLLDGEPLTHLGGGLTDLSVPESGIRPEFWTWARPVKTNLTAVSITPGKHVLTLEGLTKTIRYDVLLLTDEPSFRPSDGRLRQR